MARLALLLVLFAARPAAAFCRQTTCDGQKGPCPSDGQGCATGTPLRWPERCLSFSVQQEGSQRRKIDYDTLDTIVRTSIRQWLAADCGGGRHPALTIWDTGDTYGAAVCKLPEYNKDGPNANVWTLHDESWPYHDPGSTFAHTTLHYDSTTGAIRDADVEINSFGVPLTTSNDDIMDDLQSIATHEAGHFFGLADSPVPDATMYAGYSPESRAARSLSPDDIAGICALYPPETEASECKDPTPVHGFSLYCGATSRESGCSVSSGSAPRGRSLAPALVAAFALIVRRRARRGGRG